MENNNNKYCIGRGISIFLVMIAFFSVKVYAQSSAIPNILDINKSVSKCIYKYYKPDSASVYNCCEKGFLWIKFRIDSTNNVVDVAFSETSPEFVRKAMANAIKHMRDDIFLVTAMKKSNKTFLLPMVYDYQLGCHLDKVPKGENYYLDYMMAEGKSEKFHMSLLKMLNLTDGNFSGFDCVILNAIMFGAQSGY